VHPAERTEHQFLVGMTIDHGGFRGTVIGINSRDLVMEVRVTEAARHAPQNRIGRVIEVPIDSRVANGRVRARIA
jgi:hypothetical protein